MYSDAVNSIIKASLFLQLYGRWLLFIFANDAIFFE